MNRVSQFSSPRFKQRGAAILIITMILLVVATIGTLMIGRVGLVEQKIVGTDVRSKEVYSAAVGGMEYALDWYKNNFDAVDLWTDSDGDGDAEAGDTATPAALANTVLTADSYTHTITYTLLTDLDTDDGDSSTVDMPVILRVTSTATAVGDSHITKTVTQEVMRSVRDPFSDTSSGGPGIFDGPPIIVEDCMGQGVPGAAPSDKVTGTPDIYPNGGIAIGTTSGSAGCVDNGNFNLNGGTIEALSPSNTLWNSVFGADITEADLYALEAREPERVYIVDDTTPNHPSVQSYSLAGGVNGNWHTDLDDPAIRPYLLYFEESVGCPKINGSRTVYGLVYYEADNCQSHGFGGGEIHGTIAVTGSMMKHSANTAIYGEVLDFGGGGGSGNGTTDDPGFAIPSTAEIPGTWRDY